MMNQKQRALSDFLKPLVHFILSYLDKVFWVLTIRGPGFEPNSPSDKFRLKETEPPDASSSHNGVRRYGTD